MRPQAFACVVGSACLLALRVASATEVDGGRLATDTTWTAAASPYVVRGDLTIASGARLTLQPGVEVQIASGDALAGGSDPQRVELLIAGAIDAQGSASAPIRVHALDSPGANAWGGIVIQDTATGARFDFVTIEDANNALTSAVPGAVLEVSSSTLSHNVAGLWLTAGAPSLHELALSENSAYGVFALANSQPIDFRLSNSVLRNNGSYGVYASAALGQSVAAALQNCTIFGNVSAGVTVRASGAGSRAAITLRNAIVASNGILGLDASASDDGSASITPTYSDLWSNGQDFAGVEPGTGCLAEDPRFVAAPADLHLSYGSACIDSGSAVGAPVDDISGRARPNGAGFELGAYEFYDEASAGSGGERAAVNGAGAGGDPGETRGDAGTGTGTGTGTGAGGEQSCGCRLAPRRAPAIWPWVGLALLALRRRLRA